MKICIISNFYPPFFFGGEKNLEWVANGLVRKGHELTVITTSPNRTSYTEVINGCKIYRFFPLTLYPPYHFQKIPTIIKPLFHALDLWNPYSFYVVKRILEKNKSDLVHIENYKGLSLSIFSAVKSCGLPVVFTAKDYSLICPRATLCKSNGEICQKPTFPCRGYVSFQMRLIKNKVDVLVSPAQFIGEKLNNSGLFLDVKYLCSIVGLPQNYGIYQEKKHEVINIIYVGGLNKVKGIQILINAFKSLKLKNIFLHIIGKGQDSDEMKRLAGDDERIIFHGFVSNERLIELRQKANIAVVPSIWYDPGPAAVYENYSYGIPVIGSKIGGISELIEENYNGYLFDAGNSEQLRALLEKLIINPNELKRLEAGAYESSKNYDIENHIDRLEGIYRSLLKLG